MKLLFLLLICSITFVCCGKINDNAGGLSGFRKYLGKVRSRPNLERNAKERNAKERKEVQDLLPGLERQIDKYRDELSNYIYAELPKALSSVSLPEIPEFPKLLMNVLNVPKLMNDAIDREIAKADEIRYDKFEIAHKMNLAIESRLGRYLKTWMEDVQATRAILLTYLKKNLVKDKTPKTEEIKPADQAEGKEDKGGVARENGSDSEGKGSTRTPDDAAGKDAGEPTKVNTGTKGTDAANDGPKGTTTAPKNTEPPKKALENTESAPKNTEPVPKNTEPPKKALENAELAPKNTEPAPKNTEPPKKALENIESAPKNTEPVPKNTEPPKKALENAELAPKSTESAPKNTEPPKKALENTESAPVKTETAKEAPANPEPAPEKTKPANEKPANTGTAPVIAEKKNAVDDATTAAKDK